MTPRPSGIIFLACVAMLASTILPGGCQRLDRLDVEEEDACYTVDNVRCVFPFRFAGRFFDRCTNLQDKDNRFWCSTKTRPNGQHVEGEGNLLPPLISSDDFLKLRLIPNIGMLSYFSAPTQTFFLQ